MMRGRTTRALTGVVVIELAGHWGLRSENFFQTSFKLLAIILLD